MRLGTTDWPVCAGSAGPSRERDAETIARERTVDAKEGTMVILVKCERRNRTAAMSSGETARETRRRARSDAFHHNPAIVNASSERAAGFHLAVDLRPGKASASDPRLGRSREGGKRSWNHRRCDALDKELGD
jgi:hypothetical protein